MCFSLSVCANEDDYLHLELKFHALKNHIHNLGLSPECLNILFFFLDHIVLTVP